MSKNQGLGYEPYRHLTVGAAEVKLWSIRWSATLLLTAATKARLNPSMHQWMAAPNAATNWIQLRRDTKKNCRVVGVTAWSLRSQASDCIDLLNLRPIILKWCDELTEVSRHDRWLSQVFSDHVCQVLQRLSYPLFTGNTRCFNSTLRFLSLSLVVKRDQRQANTGRSLVGDKVSLDHLYFQMDASAKAMACLQDGQAHRIGALWEWRCLATQFSCQCYI